MLQYLFKGIGDFLRRPDIQRAIKNAIIMGLKNPSTRREAAKLAEKAGETIVESAEKARESIVDFFASITIKITLRQNETRIIIDASSKISYQASNIHNSTVVQGSKITINNYKIKLFVTTEDIPELENLLIRLEKLKEKCSSFDRVSQDNIIRNVKIEYETLNKELVGRLSRITDYHTLQLALGTED
jgi:hypothetical protein